jgi:two-component system cell cycle sensor histidine kinase/response regulator CckA
VGAIDPSDRVWPAAMSYAVIFASVFVSIRAMVIVAGVSLAATAVMMALHPAYNNADLVMPPFAIQTMIFTMFILAARFRDRVDSERRELLRHSEKMLTEAQSLASLGNWSIHLKTGESFLSRECQRLLDCETLPDSGLPGLLDLLTEGDREDFERSVELARAARGKSFSNTLILQDREEQTRHVHSIVMLSPADGREDLLEGTFQDVSGRVLAERAQEELASDLAEARRLETIGRLAGGIAHDFNNQLTVILSSCYALGEASPDDPDLQAIKKAADHSAELTGQLLSYASRQVLDVTVVDANSILTKLRPVLLTLVPDNVELSLLPCTEQATLSGDATQIEQVVINLVANACQAMPHGGKVSVRTSMDQVSADNLVAPHMKPGAYVTIEVQDSGEGMDSETMERIFDPFFTTREVGRGTGLGLATVHSIVKQCDGHVSVRSSEKEGTTFRIYFPYADAVAQEEIQSQEPDLSSLQGSRILVVDDQRAVGTAVCRALERSGCEPVLAIGAQQALDLFKDDDLTFDLLISDVVMPQMSGPDLAKELRANLPELKVLFVSGYSSSKDTSGAHFLSKPFHPAKLVRLVSNILSQPEDVGTHPAK